MECVSTFVGSPERSVTTSGVMHSIDAVGKESLLAEQFHQVYREGRCPKHVVHVHSYLGPNRTRKNQPMFGTWSLCDWLSWCGGSTNGNVSRQLTARNLLTMNNIHMYTIGSSFLSQTRQTLAKSPSRTVEKPAKSRHNAPRFAFCNPPVSKINSGLGYVRVLFFS